MVEDKICLSDMKMKEEAGKRNMIGYDKKGFQICIASFWETACFYKSCNDISVVSKRENSKFQLRLPQIMLRRISELKLDSEMTFDR